MVIRILEQVFTTSNIVRECRMFPTNVWRYLYAHGVFDGNCKADTLAKGGANLKPFGYISDLGTTLANGIMIIPRELNVIGENGNPLARKSGQSGI